MARATHSKLALPATGEWWVPSNPDKKLAGKLEVDPAKGASLTVVGRFGGKEVRYPVYEWIHGYVTGVGALSLYGCTRVIEMGLSGEIGGEEYDSVLLYVGAHLSDDTAQFKEAMVSITGLNVFSDDERVLISTDAGGSQFVVTALADIPLFSRGGIAGKFSFGYEYSNADKTVITPHTNLLLSADKPAKISELWVATADIENLISLSSRLPASRSEFSVRAEGSKWIDVYGRDRVIGESGEKKPGVWLVRLSEFQPTPFSYFSEWMGKCEVFRPAMHLALSGVYNENLYTDNDFVNLMLSLEGFHRRLFGNSEVSEAEHEKKVQAALNVISSTAPRELRDWVYGRIKHKKETPLFVRLQQLREYVGIRETDLSNGLLQRIVATRNYKAHYDETRKSEGLGDDEYIPATQFLRTWASCCFLRLIGFEKAVVERKFYEREGRAVRWLGSRSNPPS